MFAIDGHATYDHKPTSDDLYRGDMSESRSERVGVLSVVTDWTEGSVTLSAINLHSTFPQFLAKMEYLTRIKKADIPF